MYYSVIHAIHGRRGHGKSLYLTYKLLLEHVKGKQIYANYKLNFPPNKNKLTPLPLRLGQLIKFEYSPKGVIGFDEVDQYLDSHNMNKISRLVMLMINQSRHTQTDLYFSNILRSDVDKRLRKQCDYVTACRARPTPKRPVLFEYKTYDINNDTENRSIMLLRLYKKILKLDTPKPYFDSYTKFSIWENEKERKEIMEMIK